MNKLLSFSIALVVCFLSTLSFAESSQLTGVFSNIAYNRESGDLSGIEVFITNSREGYYVQFQSAQGEALPPILVKAVVDDSNVEFTLPNSANDYSGKFKGKIAKRGLYGRFENGQLVNGKKDFFLKRRKSYWE